MLNEPMDILNTHPIRMYKAQKRMFQSDVLSYANDLGYNCCVENGIFGLRNIVIGNPQTAKYLVTAHYDTPANLPFPNLITPCSFFGCILYMLALMVLFLGLHELIIMIMNILFSNPALSDDIGLVFLACILFLLIAGPANSSNANDNTSGIITVLEIARALPQLYRDKVCFVLFDMEEQGLIGSAAYRWKHRRESNDQIVLNLDCVGDGDHILFMPFKKARKDQELIEGLSRISGEYDNKYFLLKHKGFRFYPSDQSNFPKAVAIGAFRWNKLFGYYCDKIHTKKDTILEHANIKLLASSLIALIANN